MKRLFLVLVVCITFISTYAVCINRSFTAYDDGEYFGSIQLTSDCRFTITTIDNERFTGTYDIKAENIERGYTYTIVFNVSDGRVIKGTYMLPTEENKQYISLDGWLFEAKY